MPRINVEEKIWSDPRLTTLTLSLGSQGAAIGELVRFWRYAQEAWLDHRLIDASFFKQHLCQDLLSSGFAEMQDGGVYCKGAEESFAWILQRKEAGRKGGLTTQAKLKQRSGGAKAVLKQTQASCSSSSSISKEKRESQNRLSPLSLSWNQICTNLPKVLGCSNGRRQKEKTRIRRFGEEDLKKAMLLVNESTFCQGENDRGWKMTFDFLVASDENVLKILEGKYTKKKAENWQEKFIRENRERKNAR